MRQCLARSLAGGRRGRVSGAIAGLLCVVAVLVTASGASADSPLGDLNAQLDTGSSYAAPITVDSVSGSATLNGVRSGDFSAADNDLAVTNLTSEFSSTSPISDFPYLNGPLDGPPFTSFPVFGSSQAAFNPGDTYFPNLNLESTLPVAFSSGVTLARSVSPTSIPAGGADQLVTVAVTPAQPVQVLKVAVQEWPENASFVSSTAPSNLQGEILIGGGDAFALLDPVPGKTYTFTFTLSVPNPYGARFDAKPEVDAGVETSETKTCCTGPSNSLTVSAPSLNGTITLAVDQIVPQWSLTETYGTGAALLGGLLPPTSKDECKNGGWQAYGIFKNQGDCVSYVATGGKNPPNG